VKSRDEIRVEGLQERLLRAVARTDSIRLAGLERASVLEQAKAGALRRERARLAEKHGENDASVRVAERRLATSARLRAELTAEVGAARIQPPKVGAGRFVVYGRVVDSRRRPLRDETVEALGDDGAVAGTDRTAADGSFAIEVDAPRSGATAPPASERLKSADAGAGAAPPGVRLRVAAPDGKVVHEDVSAQPRVSGTAAYREVVLRTGGGPEREGPSPPVGPWHSVRGSVYHNNPDCGTGNNIEEENVREGTGGKPLCRECTGLNRAAAP